MTRREPTAAGLRRADPAPAAGRRGRARARRARRSSAGSARALIGAIACGTVAASFVLVASWRSCSCVGLDPEQRAPARATLPAGSTSARCRSTSPSGRPAVGGDDPGRHRHRRADPPLLHRLHARRAGVLALLRVPEPVHLRDADAGARRQPAAHVRRLGGRRPLLVRADRLLVQGARERARPATRPSSSTASATSASSLGIFLLFWALDAARPRHARLPRAARARRTMLDGQIVLGRAGRRRW